MKKEIESFTICENCGADYGLHKYDTNQCPVGGVEETREGHKQQWATSVFFDSSSIKEEIFQELIDKTNRPFVRDFLNALAKENGFENWDAAINNGSLSIEDDTAMAIEKYLNHLIKGFKVTP